MDFYYMDGSGPCRAVMLTASAVGVSLNKRHVDITKKEQMRPEFVALNPRHCIPTLVDGDLVLVESRAICTYLVTKYGKEELYPATDAKTRYLIDKYLYFEMGLLGKRLGEYIYPVFYSNEKADPVKLAAVLEAVGILNVDLEGHKFCVGDKITVADFVLIPTISNIIEVGVDLSKYPNVTAWAERCQNEMVGYDTENGKGAKLFGSFFEGKI